MYWWPWPTDNDDFDPICTDDMEILDLDGLDGNSCISFYSFNPEGDWKLLMIRSSSKVGTLPNGVDVYRISKVSVLSLSKEEPKDLDIEVSTSSFDFGIHVIIARKPFNPDYQT